MALAMTSRQSMAGRVPAIRVWIALSSLLLASSPVAAQMDRSTQNVMRRLHRVLMLAEQNLGLALKDTDIPRVMLVNELLSNLTETESKFPANACLQALENLGSATVSAVFAIQPVVKGELGSMTREDLRFSELMRPSADFIQKQFDENSAAYRIKVQACEDEIRVAKTSRSLPEKLSQK